MILETLIDLLEQGVITTDEPTLNFIRLPRIELQEFAPGFSPNDVFEARFWKEIELLKKML